MVVTQNYKYYIFNVGKNKEQLFDLVKDPGEIKPVTQLPEYKKELLAHRQMLKEWMIETSDPFNEKSSTATKKTNSKSEE